MATQEFLSYIVGGPAFVNTLTSLDPADVVTIRATPSTIPKLIIPTDLPTCFTTGQPAVAFGCVISTIAGTGQVAIGDGVPAVGASLRGPSDILVHPDGRIFIVDSGNNVIRYVDTDGLIHTFAGTGSGQTTQGTSDLGNGLPGTASNVSVPQGHRVRP